MMNRVKIWLIIAAALIVIGAAVFTAMLANAGWDFQNLSTDKFTTKTYTSIFPITNISVDSVTADISFYFTESDSTKVVCDELEKAPHNVSFDNGNLVINQKDNRAWYDRVGIHFKSPKIKIYLPQSQYGALNIDVITGDISIPAGFTFESITIDGTTCDVELSASATGALKINAITGDVDIETATFYSIELDTTSGDMELSNVSCQGDLRIDTSTGELELEDIQCSNFSTYGTTGDISLSSVIARNMLTINRTTGDVEFTESDAKDINIRITTGDVTGDLLTGKTFTAESSTGKVSVPPDSAGGTCVIITSTGDIKINAG